MDKYIPIGKLISNENVVHVLSGARLPGEGDLLLEIVETSREKDVFRIYALPRNYNSNTDRLTFFATVTKEKGGGRIRGWYVNFKGVFKESS